MCGFAVRGAHVYTVCTKSCAEVHVMHLEWGIVSDGLNYSYSVTKLHN